MGQKVRKSVKTDERKWNRLGGGQTKAREGSD